MKGLFEAESVEDTWAVARRFAAELRPGDVVCLEGDLGAGKTTFVQGVADALGVKGRVTSPTFCIVQEHESPKRGDDSAPPLLIHMDLYRLHGEEDVEAIGWEDYLARGAAILVEWPQRAGSLIPPDARRVHFTRIGDGERRQIRIDEPPPEGEA